MDETKGIYQPDKDETDKAEELLTDKETEYTESEYRESDWDNPIHGPDGTCECHTHGGLRQGVNCVDNASDREKKWVEEKMLRNGYVVKNIQRTADHAQDLIDENRKLGEKAKWLWE